MIWFNCSISIMQQNTQMIHTYNSCHNFVSWSKQLRPEQMKLPFKNNVINTGLSSVSLNSTNIYASKRTDTSLQCCEVIHQQSHCHLKAPSDFFTAAKTLQIQKLAVLLKIVTVMQSSHRSIIYSCLFFLNFLLRVFLVLDGHTPPPF